MADNIQTKILEIQVRYDTALQQIAKWRSEIDQTRQHMIDLKAAHKDGSLGTQEFQHSMSACEQQIKTNQQSIAVLTRQIQSQRRAEKEQEGSLNQLRAQLSKATAEYDAMSRAERESAAGQELKKKINDITTELKGAEAETQRFYRNVGNYQEAVSGLEKVEQKVKGVGKALLGMAGITSISVFGKEAEKIGSAYQDQMGKVLAVTNANTIELAQMSAEVERLGSTTRYTAQEAGEAMEFLTRNGLNAVNATGTLSGVLHLAQANAIELGEAADIVTGQMNAFHLKVSDVTHINDVLSYTCANSATNITQLNEALRNTAPIAYTAGVSIDETCAALATLADNNIKGADSGTILRQTFNGMLTSTKLTEKAYKELGIEMNLSTVKADGLVGSLKRIMDAGPSVQQLSDIFGRRAVPGVMALTNSLDLLERKFISVTESAAGTTDRMFQQSYSQFTVAAKSLESAWEGFLIQLWGGTNQVLRDKFVAEANELDNVWGEKISMLEERAQFKMTQAESNPTDSNAQAAAAAAQQNVEEARRLYQDAKDSLSERMQYDLLDNEELAQRWREAATSLEGEYMPKIATLKAQYEAAQEVFNANPEEEGAQQALLYARSELNEATKSYTEARNTLYGQVKAEAAGGEELADQWVRASEAVSDAKEKMVVARRVMEEAKADAEANPSNDALFTKYQELEQEYYLAQELYNKASAEFTEVHEDVNANSGSGIAQSTTNVLNELTAMVQWIKANIDELTTLIMSLIAGISLSKLVSHVKTSAGQMKNDLITNANAASQKVQNLITKETLLRKQADTQTRLLAKASGEERSLIEKKLQITNEQIRQTELAKQKALIAEQKVVQTAAASATASGWKGAMTSATLAVKGFVTASKTAVKSFALTAILSLAIELIMKLWDALDSGDGVFGKIGGAIKSFIQTSLQKLGQVVVDVINYFVDLYNSSEIVRGSIAFLGGVFKTVWAVVKAGAEGLVNVFRLLGDVIGMAANIMKNFLAGNWADAIKGVTNYGVAIQKFFKAQVSTGINAGKEIADGFVESFKNMDKKLEKVEWKPASNSAAPSNNVGGGGGVTPTGDLGNDDGAEAGGGVRIGNGGKSGKGNTEAERKKREKLEMEALANLQNELYKIEAEGAEKRRNEVEAQYDKRIDKLRTQLATEKNLTETAREAITQLILVIEQEKTDALEKLSKAERKKVIEEEIKNNEARLNLIRKGTGAELSEKIRGIEAYRDAAIKAANDEIADEDERNGKIAEIIAAYEQQRISLISGSMDTELGIRLSNLDKKHEIAVQEAEDAISVEKAKLAKLHAMTEEEYNAMSDEQRDSYDRQLQEATEALARRQETLSLINEQYVRDTTAAQEESEAQSIIRQKQALADRILMMQNNEDERLQLLRNGQVITEEEELADQQRKLESIGGFEAQKLQIQAEYAQQAYESVLERGQLSTQTEDEYNREVEEKRAANLAAKKNIDEAYVKQEQAKYNAMKSLTSSLTGLLDTLGESNKAFAVMSKVITLAQIAIDTGKAISAGIASAAAVPFPGNIAAIATTVATIVANVATAISTVKSAKFAQGGKVNGPGTGTSDSIPAMLSNGEFVMTASATRIYEPLLVAMNNIGKGVPMQVIGSNRDAYINESLTESFSAAVKDIQPVVSVSEINEVQSRVRTIENLDTF